MKIKTTRKEIDRNFDCIAIGYCGIQTLLKYEEPVFYTCGTYGWNFDAYVLYMRSGRKICITTGYRGTVNNCKNNCNTLYSKYEELAQKIVYNRDLKYEEQKKQVNELLLDFLDECFKEV